MRRLLPYADVLIANEEDAEKVLGINAGNTDVTTGKLDSEGYIDVAGQISKEFGIPYIATTLKKTSLLQSTIGRQCCITTERRIFPKIILFR